MKLLPTIKKIAKYCLITGIFSICVLLGSYTYLLKADYSFTLPKFINYLLEKKIKKQAGADLAEISSITIKKQDDKAIVISVGSVNTSSKGKTSIEANNINYTYEIGSFFNIGKKYLHIEKVVINTDNINSQSSSGSSIRNFDSLNKLLNKKIRLSWLSFYELEIKDLSFIHDTYTENCSVNYDTKKGYHSLDIKFSKRGEAKFYITAQANKYITKIDAEIKNFPLWFLTKLSSPDLHSDFVRHLDHHFLVNSNINYLYKNDSAPKLNFSLEKTPSQHSNIKNFTISISNKDDKNLYLNKILVETNDGGSLVANGSMISSGSFSSQDIQITAETHINKMKMSYIGDFWPKFAEPETRSWIIKSFKKGLVNKASLHIKIKDMHNITKDDFNAFIDFHDLELDYFDEHKALTKISGTANFNIDSVKIAIEKGYLISSKILPSTVQIDYGLDDVPIIIKTRASGNASDFTHMVDSKTREKLLDKGIDIDRIDGNLKTNIYLKFALAKPFDLSDTEIDVTAKLSELRTNLYNKIFLTNGELKLVFNNKLFSLSGPIDINEQNSNFEWISSFENSKKGFDTKFTIYSFVKDNSSFEEIFNNKIRILDGHALLNVVYYDKNGAENLQVSLDLDDANFYIPSLGIKKNKKIVSTLTIDLYKNPNQDWLSKKLILDSADGINIHGTMAASSDFSEIKSANINFIYPRTNFVLDLKQDEKNKNINIRGHEINLANAHITEIFSNNQFIHHAHAQKQHPAKRINLSLFIDKAHMNNDVKFTNILANFDCLNLQCKKSDLNIDINNNSKLKIWRGIKDNKPIWKLHASNASELLKGLGMYHDFIGGELEINSWEADKGKSLVDAGTVMVGDIKLKNFDVIKNPIVTKLVSFTSVMGILNIFTNMNKIPFDELNGYFVFADDVLRLNRVNAYGSYLTLTMNGTVDWNYNDIDIYGKVVPPVYGFNYLLSFIPFIGHTTAGDRGKGLIAANYSITGNIGTAKVVVNPLSILFTDIFEFMIL